MVKWITISLAVIGLCIGLWTVLTSYQKLPDPLPSQPPSINPFENGIASSGVIEAASRNISITAPESGLVTKVMVDVNQQVKTNDPLFQLDTRALEADLVNANASLEVAKAELDQVSSGPRPEDLPPLKAAVDQAKAQEADAQDVYERTADMLKNGAATPGETRHRKFLVDAAKAAVAAAQAKLDQTAAGAWSKDIQVSNAKVTQAQKQIESLQLRIERLTVRSPINGTILRRSIEPGEFVAGVGTSQSMVVGDISVLHVRAQVDEEDAPQLVAGARGVARLRGMNAKTYSLRMIRIEPLAMPKLQLNGMTQERVDTRVVEAVFEVERSNAVMPFPGQVVDVFIDSSRNVGKWTQDNSITTMPETAPAK